MTPAETAGLTFAELVEYVLRAGPLIAAVGIWYFGNRMERSNKRRAETEKDRHEQIMESFKQAAEDRKAALAQADKDRKATQAQADKDRKAAQSAAAAAVAALGIWVFGIGMMRSNERRAETEKDRHTQIMTAFKDAAEDRKAAQADAAEDRKVTQGMLAALTEMLRRTSPPSSQAGPQPGPAE